MTRVLVCQAIACPYWSNDHKTSYGCQRWKWSEMCQLAHTHPELDSRNQYALYLENGSDLSLEGLKNENDAFFREDPKYGRDLQFQKSHPDWRTKYPTREIANAEGK